MAYVTGFQLRGSAVIVHRLGVIQTWAGSDRAKVDALIGVWSPRRARYDVELGPGYLGRPMPRDLGGGLAAVSEMVVEEGETVRLRGVQVDVGSVNPLVIEGYTDSAPRIEAHLNYRIDKEGLVVSGDLINRSDLDLTNVTLMVAGTSQRLPDFPAGEVLRVNTATTSDRALPGGGTGFDPFPAANPYGSYYYPGSYGPLAAEITGVPDCWSTPDRQRQCNLVTSILNADWRGSGAYLFGWTERVPVDMQVLNANARMEDVALVIVELASLPVASVGEAAEVPPGLMTWRLLDSNPTGYGYVSSPYDFYLPPGEFLVVRFEPLPLVQVPQVARLVIHLEAYYGASTTPPIVAIHNFATRRWDTIAVGWGDTTLQDAGVYVDASGGVELRIQPTYNSETSYSRFDVTLVGAEGQP